MDSNQKTERILLVVGAGLLLMRFLFLGHSPFLTDEPATQLIVDEYFASGKFPLTLFRGSQVHIPYGAGALWIYMFVRFFTWNPEWIAYVHTFLFSLGFAFLYLAIRTAYSRITAAWVFAFAASSPFLLELSRHPWDLTYFVPISGLMLWLLALLEKRGADPINNRKNILWGVAALSFLSAYAINIHLMSAALAGSVGLALLYFLWFLPKWSVKEKAVAFGGFCALFVVLLIPYIYAAWIRWLEEPMHSNVIRNAPWGDSRNLWWIFLRETLYSSVWATKYLFDPYIKDFHAFTGAAFAFMHKVDIIGWFAKIAAYAFLFSTAFSLIRKKRVSLVTFFAVTLFFSFMVFMQYSNIPTDAHHFITVWWIVFLGAAVTRERLTGKWRHAFSWILAGNIFVNALFCFFFLGFLVKNSGVNSNAVGLGVKFHVAAVREGCALSRQLGLQRAEWDIEKAMGMQHSFRYLVRHVPECKGIAIALFPHGEANAPLALVYAEPETANPRVRWVVRK